MKLSFEELKRMAQMLLLRDGPNPSKDKIREVVAFVAQYDQDFLGHDQLIRELESIFNVSVGDASVISLDTGHIPWLDTKRADINWEFWQRYRRYLEDVKSYAPSVVNKLDSLTDLILNLAEDPGRAGHWERRGLVVGQVQSGKTSNYTGLICKAVDAGYRFIVVFAGVHNSLRSQTQLRLDEGFLGRDTQLERAWNNNTYRIGVGKLSDQDLRVAYLTNSADNGDFRRTVANQIGLTLGAVPTLLVVKKNSSVLRNLLVWLQTQANSHRSDGSKYFTDIPLLLLDDEADHASVNTRETVIGEDGRPLSEQETTAINNRIRSLLRMFAKSVYVGYTATPFANVFIHPDVNTTQIGRDLFPRDFIVNLPAPSNYIGPVRVFGLGEDVDDDTVQAGLPTVREIDDFDAEIPQDHKNGHVPNALPASLKKALRVFVLSCAARICRGQGSEHNSMLVHVTRFTSVQTIIADLIDEEIRAIRNRITYGDGNRPDQILDELEALWYSDFVVTTDKVLDHIDDPAMTEVLWEDLRDALKVAVAKITVKKINGTAKDILDYFGNPEGINVIAVGGDKLSRGLTLEGLTVSYYLRASRMYDTLMQMGRWFGYRPGYADLCRLYTTHELISWYRHITIASEELRRDFDEMARAGRTPADFGHKVRSHPGGLVVTSAGKLRNYTRMRVSFSDRLIESYEISCKRHDQESNLVALASLLCSLGDHKTAGNHFLWKGIKNDRITEFLRSLSGYPSSQDFAPGRLAEFIDNLSLDGELANWNVVLINVQRDKGESYEIANLKVGLSQRTPKVKDSIIEISNRHIISMDHEWLDLTPSQMLDGLDRWSVAHPNVAPPSADNGRLARVARRPDTGLILLYLLDPTLPGLPADQKDRPYLGYALSFPWSELGDERAIEYVVNFVYAREEAEED